MHYAVQLRNEEEDFLSYFTASDDGSEGKPYHTHTNGSEGKIKN